MNIYKEALAVQDACNLSGVVISFAKVIVFIWDEAREQGKGTDFVAKHPVSILFSSKISNLVGTNLDIQAHPTRLADAYEACEAHKDDQEKERE